LDTINVGKNFLRIKKKKKHFWNKCDLKMEKSSVFILWIIGFSELAAAPNR